MGSIVVGVEKVVVVVVEKGREQVWMMPLSLTLLGTVSPPANSMSMSSPLGEQKAENQGVEEAPGKAAPLSWQTNERVKSMLQSAVKVSPAGTW